MIQLIIKFKNKNKNKNKKFSYSLFSLIFSSILITAAGVTYASAPVEAMSSNTQLQNQLAYLQSECAQLPNLQQAIQDLQGKNEALSHQLAEQDKLIKSLTDQVSSLESDLSKIHSTNEKTAGLITQSAGSNSSFNSNPNPNPNPNPKITAKQAYQNAYELIRQKKYNAAIKAMKNFMMKYPKSSRVPDANYWLGELYLIKSDPDLATQAFREVLKFKHARHFPDSLVQLGSIYLANGDSAHAKQMFSEVIKNYPDTEAAKTAQKQLESLTQTNNK